MADKNYIGINGIVTQDLEEIRADITAQMQNIYGADINIEQNSPDGQFINILAQAKKDILDLCVQYYNNCNTETVTGIAQQILYQLNGLTIKSYSYSRVYVNVTVTQSVSLKGLDGDIENPEGTGYTVSDANGNRWILTASQNLNTGTHLLDFRAADLGAITALPNTITIMETIIAGVQSVNNPANNYETGATGETESEFRQRRNISTSMPSQGFEDATEAQLLTLPNVTQAKVYSNRTSSTVNTIPAHTVWVIVEGGESDRIGSVIYNNIPPGIPMKGSQSVTIERPNGSTDTVNYDLPSATDLYVQMNIKKLSGAIDEDYVKQQLAATTFAIGESAEAANISTIVKNIISESGTPYDVEVSTDGTNYSEIVTPSALNEYFTISTTNISITVVQ